MVSFILSLILQEIQKLSLHNKHYKRYYISSELDKYTKHLNDDTVESHDKDIQVAIKGIWELKKSISGSIEKLTKFDGYNDWRQKEAQDLSELVQRRFRYVQFVLIK